MDVQPINPIRETGSVKPLNDKATQKKPETTTAKNTADAEKRVAEQKQRTEELLKVRQMIAEGAYAIDLGPLAKSLLKNGFLTETN